MDRDTILSAQRWGNPQARTALVLLHGFGADSDDLVPLGREIDPDGAWDWHFLRAPVDLRVGGVRYGRAWFPDREEEQMQALTGEYFHQLSSLDPEGLRLSGQQVAEYCSSRIAKTARLVLGGFSQGAIVSVEAALRLDGALSGLWLCSGGLIAQERLRQEAGRRGPLRFVQSHGTEDAILEYGAGVGLFDLLSEAGWEGRLLTFSGGHSIPGEAIDALAEMAGRPG